MQLRSWLVAHAIGVRRAGWSAAVVVLLYVLAWLAVPPIVRSQLQKQGSAMLGRPVTVARVTFNPWTLELMVRDVAVAGLSGKAPQLQVARIYVNMTVQSLWRLAPVIDALQIDDPVLRLAQTAPGTFDVDDVAQRVAGRGGPGEQPPLRFALYNVQLRGGAVDFDDETVHVKHALRGLTLDLPFLSNLTADREVKVLPRLAFELDGSAFDTSAEATPFAETHQAQVRLRIRDFDLAPLAAYIPASLGVKLDSAKFNADLGLDFSEQAHAPEIRLSGSMRLEDAGLSDAQGRKWLAFDALKVTLGDVRPLERQVEIASIELKAPHVDLLRDASGSVPLPGHARGLAAQPEPKATTSSAAAWKFALGQFAMTDGALDWHDQSLRGAAAEATWQVRDWQAQVHGAVWPSDRPARFSSTLRLGGGAASGEPSSIEVQGQASDSAVQASASASGVSLALAAPYLAQYIRPAVSGTLDVKADLALQGDALTLRLQQLQLSQVSVSCATRKGCATLRQAGVVNAPADEQLALRQLEVADATIDLRRHQVQVGHVALTGPQVLVERDKAGAWMFDDWRVPAPAGQTRSQGDSAPWSASVREVQLKEGTVAWRDAGVRSPVSLNVSALRADAHDLTWDDGRLPAFGLRVQARVGAGKADPGQLNWDGSVGLAPEVRVKGSLRARNLPLQVVQAYLPDELNVDVLRADGDFSGDVNLAQAGEGLSVGVQGDAALGDVQVRLKPRAGADEPDIGNGEQPGADLLRWKALSLRGLSLALQPRQPLALDVRETALTDFFARVIVQENGRINLQDIGRAASADAAGPTAAAPSPQADDGAVAPRIHFGPVALVNGTVDFTDHFIKPNYSANLTELTGGLSAFSSEASAAGAAPQMAQLELKGRAQGTATLNISGQINPLSKPLALDIEGHMRDLELPPLSPYSVKYAGHGIERGKLNVDVTYKVLPDGQLTASNKLVLKQLAFGDEVSGAPNSLPVRLAVALLADRNGVIDVDLPISGSLNDPDFSLGPVIMRVIGNLIMKAVTAPFSLLARAFGGGDESGDVIFDPGSSALSAQALEQLDAIARALADRPALKATVVGWANPDSELQGYKHERLMDMLLAEKRREAVRAGQDATQVTQVGDDDYAVLLKRVYQRADNVKKPRNVIGFAKDIPQADMEKLLLSSIAVSDDAMQQLALARSVAVRDYLAARNVPMDRLFIGAIKLTSSAGRGQDGVPHVQLELAVD